jgi:hypothetical protein
MRLSLNISHNTLNVEGVMIGRYYVMADEKQAIFDVVIHVGTLNIDTVMISNKNLIFVNINLCSCHTVLHESRPNFPKTGLLSANGKSGVWPPGPKPGPVDSIVTICTIGRP